MKTKNIVGAALLLFVGVAVVVLVGREARRPTVEADVGAVDALPENALVVYYFHGETRCPTCRNIESFSHEAIETAFAGELAQNEVLWRVVNYEQPENSHFTTEYEIVSPTVVLVRRAARQVADWRNLTRVWELVGDRDALIDYVQQEARSMLAQEQS